MHPLKKGLNYEQSALAQRRTLRKMQQKVHQFSSAVHQISDTLVLYTDQCSVPKSTNCNPEEAVRDMKMVHSRFGATINLLKLSRPFLTPVVKFIKMDVWISIKDG